MKTIIVILTWLHLHLEGGILGFRKFVGITQCFESNLCGKFYIISGITILLFFGFSFLFVSDAKTGDDKKLAVQWLIGLFLFFCSFLSIIILSKISIIFFLLLLGGGTIAWAATQYDKKTESKK